MKVFIFISFLLLSFFYIYHGRKRVLHLKISDPKNLSDVAPSAKVSVIIPARNEEKNLMKLLPLVLTQTQKPFEIIVVDDNSSDNTFEIASSFKDVKVVRLAENPPNGWVGKSWAIWNGYLNSSGEYLLFLDADVEPSKELIRILIEKHKEYGGLVSVWPYQRLEKFYERLTLAFNLMVIYASNNLGFPSKIPSGAFGPVIFTSRKDYEFTGGHEAIKDSVLEDIKLGKLYVKHKISVTNFLGNHTVKFRMYPLGLKQLFEGFSKNMSSGATTGGFVSFAVALVWMSAIYSSIANLFNLSGLISYIIISILIYLMAKPTGDYRWYDAILYPIHYLFFLIVFFYSLYLTLFKKQVYWKGRKISVE